MVLDNSIKMDGVQLANVIKDEAISTVHKLKTVPKLAVIIVGDDPASNIYVNLTKKDCAYCGIICEEYRLQQDISTSELYKLVETLNADYRVNGILIQRPLPNHIDEDVILSSINPIKDVDALSVNSIGYIASGSELITPCTPTGIIRLLEHYNIDIIGKHCVVLGRSTSVGRPLALMLLNRNATVTWCHSHTQHLGDITRPADIIISAIGMTKLNKERMEKLKNENKANIA